MGVKKETILPGDGKSVLRGPFHEALEALQYRIQFPKIGQTVTVHYTGWDEGIIQMSVGERAKLTVTSDYAYGKKGIPGIIPPNADLVFDVELIAIR